MCPKCTNVTIEEQFSEARILPGARKNRQAKNEFLVLHDPIGSLSVPCIRVCTAGEQKKNEIVKKISYNMRCLDWYHDLSMEFFLPIGLSVLFCQRKRVVVRGQTCRHFFAIKKIDESLNGDTTSKRGRNSCFGENRIHNL